MTIAIVLATSSTQVAVSAIIGIIGALIVGAMTCLVYSILFSIPVLIAKILMDIIGDIINNR